MTEPRWKPRPTVYKGIPMRSRLEARFAAYLDSMDGWSWRYEPRAYAGSGGQYLPDFEIVVTGGALPMFVEVKATVSSVEWAATKMRIIWESEPTAVLLIALADGTVWRVGPTETKIVTLDDGEPAVWE